MPGKTSISKINGESIYLSDVIFHELLIIFSTFFVNTKYLDHQQEACEVHHEP